MTLTPEQDASVRKIVAEMLAQALSGADARIRADSVLDNGDVSADGALLDSLGTSFRRGQILDLAVMLVADAAGAITAARQMHVFARESSDPKERRHRFEAVERAVHFVAGQASGIDEGAGTNVSRALATAAIFFNYVRPDEKETADTAARRARLEGRYQNLTESERRTILGLDRDGY